MSQYTEKEIVSMAEILLGQENKKLKEIKKFTPLVTPWPDGVHEFENGFYYIYSPDGVVEIKKGDYIVQTLDREFYYLRFDGVE